MGSPGRRSWSRATPSWTAPTSSAAGRSTYAENSGGDLQVYYDYTHRQIPQWFEEHRHTLDVDYQHRRPLGVRQELVWGAGYRITHDQVGNSPGVAFLPDQVTESLFSAFAQDEITLERAPAADGGDEARAQRTGPVSRCSRACA